MKDILRLTNARAKPIGMIKEVLLQPMIYVEKSYVFILKKMVRIQSLRVTYSRLEHQKQSLKFTRWVTEILGV